MISKNDINFFIESLPLSLQQSINALSATEDWVFDAEGDVGEWIDGFDKFLHKDLEENMERTAKSPEYVDLLAMLDLERSLLLLSETSRREPDFINKVVTAEDKARQTNSENVYALTLLSRLWAVAKNRMLDEVFSLDALDDVNKAISGYLDSVNSSSAPHVVTADTEPQLDKAKPVDSKDSQSQGD